MRCTHAQGRCPDPAPTRPGRDPHVRPGTRPLAWTSERGHYAFLLGFDVCAPPSLVNARKSPDEAVPTRSRSPVPTGKVKWFDTEKGFGFLSRDDGGDVFVHASALPQGLDTLKPGTRVEFGIVEGRRGEQALSLRVLDPRPSVVAASRKKPDEMSSIIQDLLKVLEGVDKTLERGRYPDKRATTKVAELLRAVADELDT
ncbi:cold shock domain-containing protein [Streptomyces sp. SID5474]|nr:cold shock domain-containing protein [Streptomyces sp. SID5474]